MNELTFLHRKHRQLNERLQGLWGSHNRVLFVFGVIVIVLALTLAHYHEFLGKGTPPTFNVNNLCNPCNEGLVPDFCELPEEYQFKKVIWFITDGYPMYMQKKWLDKYADHALPYTVAVPGNKWSHTIYSSWFTGMPNANILARTLYGDSIFESMQRAGAHRCSLDPVTNSSLLGSPKLNDIPSFSFRWIGPTWCPVDLLGGSERATNDLNFTQIDAVTEDLDLKQHPYPSISISSLPNILKDVAEKGQSLIAHTGIIDKEAHYGVNSDASEEFLAELFSSPTLKEFIEAHPDYLLVLSSDHGRSKKGKFHGEGTTTKNGNIGMFTFYNPIFTGQNMSEIDVVDVHPTLAKYLKFVDISFYSVGEVRNTYGPNGQKYELNALKQNLLQLIHLLKSEDTELDVTSLQAALNSEDIETVRQQVRMIKSTLFHPLTRPFYVYTTISIVALLVVFFIYWTNVINNRRILITLLLAIPLGFSFGFFLKPLTSYHFQSNFTFYFGITTSFVMASGFSEWRITGYLVLNELFNLLGYFFRTHISQVFAQGSVVLALHGVILSLLESIYYFKTDKRFYYIVIYLHLLTALYFIVPSFDFYGFNVFALNIYCFLPLLLLCVLLEAALRPLRLRLPSLSSYSLLSSYRSYSSLLSSFSVIPSHVPSLLTISVTAVSLLLFNGSPLIALVNFQSRQILPCLFGTPSFSDEKKCRTASHFGLQACVVYVLQQALWITWFVWGINPDFEVDIKSGVPGIHSWNEYPVLAGVLLGLQKLGVFPLLAFHIGTVIVPNLFSLFIYSAMTLVNCLSIHFCLKKFQFKFQIETLLVITLCTFMQFVVTLLIKYSANPQFSERSPWAFNFCNQISRVARRIARSVTRK